MSKNISSSQLRSDIKRVLNEVGYGQTEYIVEKFGEPIAAVISIEDFRLLQNLKQQESLDTTEGNPFLSRLEDIQQSLQADGYQPRSKDDVDAQLKTERDSWGA